MDQIIECVGDPRAMGHCQGLAHKSAIRERISQNGGRLGRPRLPSLRGLASGSRLGVGTGREIIRHYAHLAERMAGIARNADVILPALMDLFCQNTSGAAPGDELVAEAVVFGAETCSGATKGGLVMRTLSGESLESSPWFLRKSVPEVGFESIEVTLPWLATAVAGVNERGIAVAMAPRSESYGGGVNAGAVNARSAPHAVLLVQECLQRFDSLDGCVDWCDKRPRSGNMSLVISDADGGLVQIEVEGDDCRVVKPEGGMLLDGSVPEVSSRVRDYYREHNAFAPDVLSDLSKSAGGQLVFLEPALRRLTVRTVSQALNSGSDESQSQFEFSL